MSLKLASESDDLVESHDINVTPMLDVMLVLLIIFMVAAPLATVAVPVDLPDSNAPADPRPDKPIYLSIRADTTLAIGDRDVAMEDLGPALLSETSGDKETRIYIRGDRTVPYGMLMDVMNALRTEGYTQVGLVGEEGAGAGPQAGPGRGPGGPDGPGRGPGGPGGRGGGPDGGRGPGGPGGGRP